MGALVLLQQVTRLLFSIIPSGSPFSGARLRASLIREFLNDGRSSSELLYSREPPDELPLAKITKPYLSACQKCESSFSSSPIQSSE